MKKFEVYDLLRYFHNARKKDGTLFPLLGEDALALTASLSYLLEDTNFCIKAYSGTGKTVLMDAISQLLPEDWIHTIEHLQKQQYGMTWMLLTKHVLYLFLKHKRYPKE